MAERESGGEMEQLQIEIDSGSGFCFGVTTAIRKAEEELPKMVSGKDLKDGGHCAQRDGV